eukprot:CAMPEP_0203853900 /NCGR_PEP_ID=MMETSP0359-20131031/8802_1 /ASSEMBLY_ACC=CAM_ASM_000338 /TAXON_ID=268821 /ORGANISM="Scrippsiella Hangoei, Strain SHTV-5" /LENGTH=417 /DNA_ID=CAMNT_0050770327 /DNA_START=63 /DNA_END=1316 /DNA_ORIENTATION=-
MSSAITGGDSAFTPPRLRARDDKVQLVAKYLKAYFDFTFLPGSKTFDPNWRVGQADQVEAAEVNQLLGEVFATSGYKTVSRVVAANFVSLCYWQLFSCSRHSLFQRHHPGMELLKHSVVGWLIDMSVSCIVPQAASLIPLELAPLKNLCPTIEDCSTIVDFLAAKHWSWWANGASPFCFLRFDNVGGLRGFGFCVPSASHFRKHPDQSFVDSLAVNQVYILKTWDDATTVEIHDLLAGLSGRSSLRHTTTSMTSCVQAAGTFMRLQAGVPTILLDAESELLALVVDMLGVDRCDVDLDMLYNEFVEVSAHGNGPSMRTGEVGGFLAQKYPSGKRILLLRWAKQAAQMKQEGGELMSFLQAVLYASTELEKDANRQLYAIGCLDLSIGVRREGVRDLFVLPCMGGLASASTAERTDPL